MYSFWKAANMYLCHWKWKAPSRYGQKEGEHKRKRNDILTCILLVSSIHFSLETPNNVHFELNLEKAQSN